MASNFTEHEVGSTIGSRENPLFSAHEVNTTLSGFYDAVLCWF